MWDAGSIVGKLSLDIGEYGHGMLQAEGMMHTFGPMVTEFMENPLLGVVEIAKQAGEGLVELGEKFVETLSEVASHAQKMGLEAMKAGVGVEFLSGLEAAGKRVGITVDEIGNSFKFLERNAATATEGGLGSANVIAGFEKLGISTDYLKSHMGDMESMFRAVRMGIQAIPDPAERTRAALQVLGREGAGMVPLFLMSDQAMRQHIQTAIDLGNHETAESVKAAQGWMNLKATIDDMWEGLKIRFADPFIEFVNEHWKEIQKTIMQVADALAATLPAAAKFAVVGFQLLLHELENVLLVLGEIASFTDLIHLTSGAEQSVNNLLLGLKGFEQPLADLSAVIDRAGAEVKSGGKDAAAAQTVNNNFNVNVNFDPTKTASQLQEHIEPQLRAQNLKLKQAMQAETERRVAAENAGSVEAIRSAPALM